LLNAASQERPNTSVSRWRITPIPGITEGLPGVGRPAWRIELLRMRNARPGTWHVSWKQGQLEMLDIAPGQHREGTRIRQAG
jgi:protein ImuA